MVRSEVGGEERCRWKLRTKVPRLGCDVLKSQSAHSI